MKHFRKNYGITLIALVITIIIMLILATVSIRIAVNGGLFNYAGKAVKETQNAMEAEQKDLQNVVNDLENLLLNQPQIKDNIGKVIDENKNTTVYDEYNNPVEIPAGFSIVPNGKNNVEYTYTETEDHIPSVQDGIVITDKIDKEGNSTGNEFVWIPVGKINNKEGEPTEIKLGRYKFDIQRDENGAPKGTGNETLVQSAENYDKEADEEENSKYSIYGTGDTISYFYESTKGRGNTVAKDLNGFINSATGKGGYYLARYEAGHGADKNNVVSKKGVVWNNVTQPEAATAAQAMYAENNNYTSDLTNSYAWDTAIVFIQKYQEKNEKNIQCKQQKIIQAKSHPQITQEKEQKKQQIR